MPADLDDAFYRPQFGTGIRWPECCLGGCTGCVPPTPAPPAPVAPRVPVDHDEARRELGRQLGWNPDKFASMSRRDRRAAMRGRSCPGGR